MTSTVAHLLIAPLLAVLGLASGPGTGPVTGAGPSPATGPPGAAPVAAVWPLDPRPEVAERFDPPDEAWGAGHRGVDLLGTPGQRVRSAREGTVSFAGTLAGRGVVVVSHGETRTTYEPVKAAVQVGDEVRAGQSIGILTLLGSHCWPRVCLHWGLIEGDSYLDPLTLVGAGPVRLLPLFSDLPPTGSVGATPQSPLWARFARRGDVLAGTPAAVGPW